MKKLLFFTLAVMLLTFTAVQASFASESDFEIEDGVLIAYKGMGSDIVIPEGVTSIDANAFLAAIGAPNVNSITLPNSLENPWFSGFMTCSNLQEYRVKSDNPKFTVKDGILFSKDLTQLVSFPIGLYTDSYIVPEGITSIGADGFAYVKITSIVLPDNLTSIGDNAFSSSKSLASITLPQGLTQIGSSAFNGCDEITEVTIPASVQSIKGGAFSGMLKLKDIHVDDSNNRFIMNNGSLIDRETGHLISYLSTNELTEYTIPEDVTTIDEMAFLRADKLKKIIVPGSVTEIRGYAIANCDRLANIELSEGLINIGDFAIQCCPRLKNVDLPEGLVSLGNFVFFESNSVKNVTIPSSVTSIGSNDFAKITLHVMKNSYAHQYAKENGFKTKFYQPSKD